MKTTSGSLLWYVRLLILAVLLSGSACSHFVRTQTPLYPSALGPGNKLLLSADARLATDATNYYANAASDAPKARVHRDAFIDTALLLLDESYFDFEKRLKAGLAAKDVSVTWTSIALSATATLMTPPVTKSILSAIDTGIKGMDAAFDAKVLREKTFEILNSQMRKDRATLEKEIMEKVRNDKGKATLEYTLDAARRDLGRYYYAGSVTNALTQISQVTASAAQDAELKKTNLATGRAEQATGTSKQ